LRQPARCFDADTFLESEMTTDVPRDAVRDASNEAYARMDKEITSIKTAIGDLSQRITDAVSEFGVVAREQARRVVRNARASVDPAVADAADRVAKVATAAQQQAASIGDTLQDAIEERPLSAVAFALGLGFLIGVTCGADVRAYRPQLAAGRA
jgi:ElaB/YqjD/DUF883 family membrane-anchored ribosome-binding protein